MAGTQTPAMSLTDAVVTLTFDGHSIAAENAALLTFNETMRATQRLVLAGLLRVEEGHDMPFPTPDAARAASAAWMEHRYPTVTCTNEQHDHTTTVDPDDNEVDPPIAIRCAHCGRLAHYDYSAECYAHDYLEHSCFLIAANVGTPCTH